MTFCLNGDFVTVPELDWFELFPGIESSGGSDVPKLDTTRFMLDRLVEFAEYWTELDPKFKETIHSDPDLERFRDHPQVQSLLLKSSVDCR